MGGGRWDSATWTSYASSHVDSKKSVHEIYTSRDMDASLSPFGVTIRESRDSEDNPLSTPIIVALDVTGSMSSVLEAMARTGLRTLVEEVYNRKPVSDPHIMCMGVGDAYFDSAPLQITQFEADIRIAEQLQKIWLERGGGGNSFESYILPWYFAAYHTSIDCFEKRGKRGYLFTLGDEEPTPSLTKAQIKKFIGDDIQADEITAEELLTVVGQRWEVFHLMVEQGSHYRTSGRTVRSKWEKLLGQRAMPLADHTKMGEVIISTLQILAGEDKKAVVESWDGSTSMVVSNAVKDLSSPTTSSSGGALVFK